MPNPYTIEGLTIEQQKVIFEYAIKKCTKEGKAFDFNYIVEPPLCVEDDVLGENECM